MYKIPKKSIKNTIFFIFFHSLQKHSTSNSKKAKQKNIQKQKHKIGINDFYTFFSRPGQTIFHPESLPKGDNIIDYTFLCYK